MNIKVIKTEDNTSNNSISRLNGVYKVQASSSSINTEYTDNRRTVKNTVFKVGTKVRHSEERDLIGEVKFIGSDKLSVVWNDNTRERLSFAEAQESLEYVDDTQSLVSPLSPQMSDKDEDQEMKEETLPEETKINERVSEAISALGDESIEPTGTPTGEETTDLDIEKIKMQRKINNMEQQLTAKQTNNMKENIAREIVELAIKKGMVEEDNLDLEIMSVTMLSDEDFATYKQSVIDYKDDGHRIESDGAEDPSDYDGLTPEEREAKKQLKKLKRAGSFGSGTTNTSAIDSDGETRNIKSSKQDKFGFYNQYTIPKFEEQFTDILSNAVDDIDTQPIRRTAAPRPVEQKSALPGFENLQGLTKPLMPGAGKTAAYQAPTNTNLKDLFSNMEWTTVSKIH